MHKPRCGSGVRLLLYLTVLVCAGMSSAGSVRSTLKQAERLIQAGQASAALELCLEARLENPDSEPLLFAIGSAEAAVAERLANEQEPTKAAEKWQEAWSTFQRLEDSPDYGGPAMFNAATCLLRRDGTFETAGGYEARVENLRNAVRALERCLEQYPEHDRAQKNLDHARYLLCMLLQHPPGDRKDDTPQDEEKEPGSVAEVANATTEIAGAEAEVVDGSTVVLKVPGAGRSR